MIMLSGLFLVFLGCEGEADQRVVEPIEVPSNPSEWGVPVGVKTIEFDGERLEVWYPAVSLAESLDSDHINFSQFVPDLFASHIGIDDPLPVVPTEAVRNADIRFTDSTVPVLIFSHGFGGMRVQSFGITSHLASRGYVVVAPDHPGRMLTDVLPCLIAPPLDGCDLSGFGSDPAQADLNAAFDWVEHASNQAEWKHMIDAQRVGLFGHSAGAGSVVESGNDDRYTALAMMAGGGPVSRDVPVLRMDASCDGFVPSADGTVLSTLTDGRFVQILGGGHMAFTDLCELELGILADEVIAPRSDANTALLPQLRGLAVDGCPGQEPIAETPDCEASFLALTVSDEIIRYHLTNFFDVALRDHPDLSASALFEDAEIWTQ